MQKLLAVLFSTILVTLTASGPAPLPQEQDDIEEQVEALLEQMSPEQRVGQLFLVTFYGDEVLPQSDVAMLITDYHIGGVVLRPVNGNFTPDDTQVQHIYTLTSDMQSLAAHLLDETTATAEPEPEGSNNETGPFIPLLIAVDDGFSGWPTDSMPGTTRIPSNMSLGATWNPDYAYRAGQIVGFEMDALGINMLLGPNADVVEDPQPTELGDQGTYVFGGEPYWVSEMTRAYVAGVHAGSESRVVVIPRHFPGYGSADRLATVEIPTVRRTLDQLTQFDLQPFFATTVVAGDPLNVIEGVVTGHISYLGFQGDNPRQSTRPISLDSTALQVLLELEQIKPWYEGGGLLVTDSLGLRGVRRFYDSTEVTFLNRRIAQDALLAGNDLLYLGDFGLNPVIDQTQTIIDTHEFFVQAYNEDAAFQQRVDLSVRRILRAKLALYPEFTLDEVIGSEAALVEVGQGDPELNLAVAQDSVTLVSPIDRGLLVSPEPGQDIVVVTDSHTTQRCTQCDPVAAIEVDAFQSAVLRLYGPQASGQVSFADIQSFTLAQLDNLQQQGDTVTNLDVEETPVPNALELALNDAEWVIFVISDSNNTNITETLALRAYLADAPAVTEQQIVVISTAAPYYLDSTEISKLAGYYVIYDSGPSFIDVAARALYLQVQFNGASPVSIPGIQYDIIDATSPDASQIITLDVSIDGVAADVSATPATELTVVLGDTVTFRTRAIVDTNGNVVPDGTPVQFTLNYPNEGLRNTLTSLSQDGVATTSVVLDRTGLLEVTASSSPALNSSTVQLPVPDTGSGAISVVPPEITLEPTSTSASQPSPSPDGVQTAPQEEFTAEEVVTQRLVDFGDLFFSILGLGILVAVIYVGAMLSFRDTNNALLIALPALVAGLIGYNYYAMQLPGSGQWQGIFGLVWGAPIATWSGALLGVGGVLLGKELWEKWLIRYLNPRYYRREDRSQDRDQQQ